MLGNGRFFICNLLEANNLVILEIWVKTESYDSFSNMLVDTSTCDTSIFAQAQHLDQSSHMKGQR